MTLFSRARRERHIDAVFADAAAISDALGEVEVPADIAAWLGRLHALIGVPFGYLVPDERMLPPESIRFFRLDENWVRALLDGAFSLGRDLTTEADGASANVDRAAFPAVFDQAREAAPRRAREGVADAPGAKAWTGFLLRSSVVADYPGLGVNVYPKDGTPDDKTTVLLDVKRLDRLGPNADTLLCLVEGDAFRVDVHEAPELLHYGIDDYELKPGGEDAHGDEAAAHVHAREGRRGEPRRHRRRAGRRGLPRPLAARTQAHRARDDAGGRQPAPGWRARLGPDGLRDDRGGRHGQLRAQGRTVRAIVPLNVAALRVSNADQTNVTPGFAGRAAAFDLLPHGDDATEASTGDTVWLPLDNDDPPTDALAAGIHLHWELPECFKRGRQNPDDGSIAFPPAPARWLVVRSLSAYDTASKTYGAPRHASWIVESDYVAPGLQPDGDGIRRPAVAVPLTAPDGAPAMFMGRVVGADRWDPASEPTSDYLPAYPAADGRPQRLTAIGFVGAAFSSYYPDCRSVFGFWDTFADDGPLHNAVNKADPIRFRASYSVVGWLPDAADDPLAPFAQDVKRAYERYVVHCRAEKVEITQTPVDIFRRLASERLGWDLGPEAASFTRADDKTLTSLTLPEATVCAGVIQDVVWDALDPLDADPVPGRARTGRRTGAPRSTRPSATRRSRRSPRWSRATCRRRAGRASRRDFEVLLDALQLGLLRDLEANGSALVVLEQARHAAAFSGVDGGHVWTVQAASTEGPGTASAEVTLPLTLAEQLAALNLAQRAYDQGRERLAVIRSQLFMDWIIYVKQLVAQPDQPVVDTSSLSGFLATASGGELNAVIDQGAHVGMLHYEVDPRRRQHHRREDRQRAGLARREGGGRP